MKIAPIILFVYCRPYHTQKTVEALKANYLASQSDLYIFSDGPKDIKVSESVNRVREYIHEIDGFRSVKIKERTGNLGLANSIIAGVSEVISLHGRVIVLEDDLVSSPNFLDFANRSLEKYESEKKIFSIAGYTYNLQFPPLYDYGNYFSPRCESLGWGTWIDRWQKADWKIADFKNFLSNKDDQKTFSHGGEDLVDMLRKQLEGKIDSWAVRWCYAHFRNEAYCSYPVISKIIHIGTDKYATHVKFRKRFLDTKLDPGEQREFNLSPKILVEDYIQIQYQRIFRPNLLKKIKKQLLALFNLYKI
jgi:hypothetical protein